MVAAASAEVLIFLMFLPWYGASVKASFGGFSASRSESVNAWESYGGRDILLFLIALVVFAYVVLRAFDALPRLPFDAPLGVLVLGAIAALLVLIGLLHIPTGGVAEVSTGPFKLDFSRKIGIFLGFLATLGITYGGWAAYAESRRRVTPAAAGPGGGLSGPGAVPPPGPSSATSAPTTAAPTEPLGTSGPPSAPPTPPATPPVSESGSAPGAAPGTAPAATGGAAVPTPTPGPSQPAAPPSHAAQPGGTQANPPADWYPDPHGQARLRWWDGSQWTDQTAD